MNYQVHERKRLGEWLQETAGLDSIHLDSALAEQRLSGGLLGEILVGKGLISERTLLEALGRQWNVPYLEELDLGELDPALLGRLPVPFLLRHKMVPARQENGSLLVATVSPLNLAPVDALSSALEMRTEIALAPERLILNAIHSLYEREEHSAGAMIDELNVSGSAVEAPEGSELGEELDLSHDAPVIKLVNRVIYQAARDRASDIHWEPFEKEMRVRLRVDGVLHDILRFDQRYQAAVTARLKIMAGMDIAERRLPQDGRIQRKVGSREIDMRVSSVPTIHGERLVLRLLDRSNVLHSLEDIGFSGEQFEIFGHLIHRAHGIILVTGPTGSGKTTTLYAAIQKLHKTDTNIMTIEDPVEYQLEGIAQMQISAKTGFGFSEGLRSVLRQDPDVILVGEIRDRETAEVAIHASLTGHLVFSTLHTNNAVGAITRLVDMGIEPFLISSSVIAVLAQRLSRRVCPCCAQVAPVDPAALKRMGIKETEIPALAGCLKRGRGCPECYETGYRGRTGIFELLTIDDDLRGLIMTQKDTSTLNAAAVKKGMRTLLDDGARKVAAGITTPEEILRIIQT